MFPVSGKVPILDTVWKQNVCVRPIVPLSLGVMFSKFLHGVAGVSTSFLFTST